MASTRTSYLKGVYHDRIHRPLVELIQSGISPERLTLSLAFGLTCGVFPIPGLTTVPLLLLTFVFQLNPVAGMLVNVLSTPLNLASAPVFCHYGRQLFGGQAQAPNMVLAEEEEPVVESYSVPLNLVADWRSDPVGTLSVVRDLLGYGVLLWCCVLPLLTPVVYLVLLPMVRRLVTTRKKTNE